MAHNMEALRERFGNLLDVLMHDFNLEKYIYEGTPEDIDCSWDEQQDAADHYGIWVGTGATKFVIGDDNCDYVIKFQPPYADGGDFDYCAREVEVYEEAVRAGYADKFAWCAHLLDYDIDGDTLPIYVMEWCKCDYDMIGDEMDDYHYTKFCASNGIAKGEDDAYDKYIDSKNKEPYCYQERMMEWAFSVWGLDYHSEDYALCNFMKRMSINDLHSGNWGWCDNRLVLTDYSGYGECLSARSIDY